MPIKNEKKESRSEFIKYLAVDIVRTLVSKNGKINNDWAEQAVNAATDVANKLGIE